MTLNTKTKVNIHHKAYTGICFYSYYNNHLATPQELRDEKSEIVWLSYDWAVALTAITKSRLLATTQ